MALPGSPGRPDPVSSPGYEAGRRRTIGVVAALSIKPRTTTPVVRRWVAGTPKRHSGPEGRGCRQKTGRPAGVKPTGPGGGRSRGLLLLEDGHLNVARTVERDLDRYNTIEHGRIDQQVVFDHAFDGHQGDLID